MARRKKKMDPIVIATLVAFIAGLFAIVFLASKTGGPSVTIRGDPRSSACERARVSFELCMKRSGPTGIKGCASEFQRRNTDCEGKL